MIKNKKQQASIFLCLLLLWMGVIFSFSAQKADESSQISSGISYQLVHELDEKLSLGWSEKKENAIAEGIEFPIRKAAHMTEYAILGWLFMGSFSAWKIKKQHKFLLAQAGTMLYAATDEYHQTFVQGRDGSIRDVLIDGAGCLIGLCLLAIVCYSIKKKHRNNGEEE